MCQLYDFINNNDFYVIKSPPHDLHDYEITEKKTFREAIKLRLQGEEKETDFWHRIGYAPKGEEYDEEYLEDSYMFNESGFSDWLDMVYSGFFDYEEMIANGLDWTPFGLGAITN